MLRMDIRELQGCRYQDGLVVDRHVVQRAGYGILFLCERPVAIDERSALPTEPRRARVLEPAYNRRVVHDLCVSIRTDSVSTLGAPKTRGPAVRPLSYSGDLQGAANKPSHCTAQSPSSGNPGAFRSGASSQPAAIRATA